MRKHRLLTMIGAGIVSLLSGLLPAIAAPDLTYSGASRYKDAKDNIYIITGSVEKLTYDSVDVTKVPYSDACGYVSLKLSNATSSFPSTIAFNGTSDTVSSIPFVIDKKPYKCVNGVPQYLIT